MIQNYRYGKHWMEHIPTQYSKKGRKKEKGIQVHTGRALYTAVIGALRVGLSTAY